MVPDALSAPPTHPTGLQFDELAYTRALLERIVRLCPRRRPCSEDERRAHELMRVELTRLGLPEGVLDEFRFSESLYANMALHFGLGTLGTAVSGLAPAAGFVLHALAAASFMLDSTKRAFLLRRLLPWRRSQNLVVTLPGLDPEPALRLVFMAHADAALTGRMFEPAMVALVERLPGPLGRLMAVTAYSQLALAGFDLLRLALGPLTLPLRPVEALLTLPALLAFVLNLEVVLRDEVVPGANDNLSGVVGMSLLARRLLASKPPQVELVFVVTGAEEAGLGGAAHLVAANAARWDRARTVAIGLDGLSNGELRYFDEGEVVRRRVSPWLREELERVAASEPRFASVRAFQIPVGGTDVLPFHERGYDGLCLGCVDPALGAPRHYHLPSDTVENLEPGAIIEAVDFAQKLVVAIAQRRGIAWRPAGGAKGV